MSFAPGWKIAGVPAGFCLLLVSMLATNCNDQKSSRPVETQPLEAPGTMEAGEPAGPAAVPTAPAASQPTTREKAVETRPEEIKPESTYSSRPPYPVSLYVKSPSEKQPGWLRIEELVDGKQLATGRGRFPEQNRIYVETGNVRRIRIHVGHLPLRPNERVILQIDGQGMVISRSRPYTTLELLPTGEWSIVKETD